MKRLALVFASALLASLLASCSTTVGDGPQVMSTTPASIEISAWCRTQDDPQCRQQAADLAQAHCQRARQNAQYVRSALMQRSLVSGERVFFAYACVR